MSLPLGFRYLRNMATYSTEGLAILFVKDYGKDLESKYDKADKTLRKKRIFCLDCIDYKTCGKFWSGCPYRAIVMKLIKEEL